MVRGFLKPLLEALLMNVLDGASAEARGYQLLLNADFIIKQSAFVAESAELFFFGQRIESCLH